MIKIFTNHLPGGWMPQDVANGLGGSEEAVVLLAEALARSNHDVFVFHTQREKSNGIMDFNGAHYMDRSSFLDFNRHVDPGTFISFKTQEPWSAGFRDKVNIHWSCDVERIWNTDNIDLFVNVSKFHESRNLWVPNGKSMVIPFGVDLDRLDRNQTNKKNSTLFYCSSPDRGLEQLLLDWDKIKKNDPALELRVAYGFKIFDSISQGNPAAKQYKYKIMQLMNQEGIVDVGWLGADAMAKEYWSAEYWIHPLNYADAELFCLNAVKSRYCGAIPIVNKIGALKNTVGNHIPYSTFLEGSRESIDLEVDAVKPQSWDSIVDQYWSKIIG